MPINALRFLKAVEFAAYKHRFQKRKSHAGIPYVNHPITVARLLAEVGGIDDEDVLIAALLHDTLEDTETTVEELTAAFGPAVCSYVQEVTDDKSLPSAQRKQLQIDHAPHKSPGAAVIKLADKISNCSDLPDSPPADWSRQRVLEYLEWGAKVVRNLPPVNPALLAKFEEVYQRGKRLMQQTDD